MDRDKYSRAAMDRSQLQQLVNEVYKNSDSIKLYEHVLEEDNEGADPFQIVFITTDSTPITTFTGESLFNIFERCVRIKEIYLDIAGVRVSNPAYYHTTYQEGSHYTDYLEFGGIGLANGEQMGNMEVVGGKNAVCAIVWDSTWTCKDTVTEL